MVYLGISKKPDDLEEAEDWPSKELTTNGFKKGLKWSEILADYSLWANDDILRRGAIYAESNEVEN